MRISDWSLDVCSSDLKSISLLRPATASKTTSPPLPPLPPSGPPYSMYFSRRNDTAPGPPSPDLMKILAWSRKCMVGPLRQNGKATHQFPFVSSEVEKPSGLQHHGESLPRSVTTNSGARRN